MFAVVFAAAIAFNYGLSPQAAAIRAVRYPGRAPATVARVNIDGNYATVLLSGAVVEGAPLTEAMLLKRFTFGWQPLDAIGSGCVFSLRGIAPNAEARLMLGMPRLHAQTSCKGGYGNDYGPVQEIETVRKIARGPFIPFVAVYGTWAKSQWYGAGGGETYYRLRNGVWRRAFGGGGAYRAQDLIGQGVPAAALCPFMTYDARCPK